MRANILFCLYFFMGLAVQLQAQVTVTGKVIDEQQQPVPYANIVLLSLPDSAFVAGSISNEEGAFSLNVKETKDVLRISSIGYATVYRPLDNRSTDLGIICLASDTQILAEVVVKADMPVTRMRGDALVTNIQNSVLSKAGSASDVLGKVPGVIKERNSYEVLGKGTPLIYINGRQVRDDSELDQLNSEDIKSVEVVTNPGARYDATVTAVIRIQTIRRAGDGFGFDLRSSYYQSQNVDLIEQLNVNYRHNGLDIFGIFRYLKNEYIMKNDIVHTLESDSLWKYQNLLDGTVVDKSLRGEIGANYSLNDKHSLGFRYTLTSRPNTKSDVFTSNDITANNQFYDYLENQEYSSTSGKPTHQLNVYYNGTVGDLNIDFNTDYYTNTSTGKGLYHEVSQEQESRDVHTQSYIRNKLLASKLVLSYPLFGGNLSVGGEYTDTRRNDEYRNPEKYVESTISRVEEYGLSGFAEYSRQFPIGNLSLGVRYEHVTFDYYKDGVHMDEQSRMYGNWFPNLSFSRKLGSVRTQLSYTAKTQRPTYSQLSNNVTYVDRFTMQRGNPLLEPCTIHDISLVGTWRFLQLLVSYQQWRKEIIYWGDPIDNGNSMMMTYLNYHNRPTLNVSFSISPAIGFWHPNLNIGVKKQWMTIDGIEFNKPRPTIRFNNTFELPGDFLVSLDGLFMGKGNYQNLYQFKNYGTVDISVRKSFLRDALSLELRGNDLFHGSRNYWQTYFGSIIWEQTNQWDTREFSITLRYKFNTTKSKYKGTGAANDELRRL